MREKWEGCDDDCFNCKYSDCLKPANECKSFEYSQKQRNKNIDKAYKRYLLQRSAVSEALNELRL